MTTDQIYKGVLPFICIQVLSMILIMNRSGWLKRKKSTKKRWMP